MNSEMTFLMISKDEWVSLLATQQSIIQQLKELNTNHSERLLAKYITAKEFMTAVNIKRTKFDRLVQTNSIKVIKKVRKIYVPISEVERYFLDTSIF